MKDKVILITGSSTGLGKALAIKLAEQGAIVYASMRNLDKRTALESDSADVAAAINICQLDVQDTVSVNSCVERIIDEQGRIDVLINNAGAGFVRTTEQATEEDIQWVMELNFNGVVRCTKAVLPHMRTARQGHIVNISSVGGLVGQPFNEIYCAAKFAVEGYTESLASYVTPAFGINFTSVEPGGIQSEFANSALKQFQETGGMLDDEYMPWLQRYLGGAQARAATPEGAKVYQTSEQVADVVIANMVSDSPPIRVRTSEWSEEFTKLKTSADPDGKLSQAAMMDLLQELPA